MICRLREVSMAKVAELDMVAFNAWVETRPPVVQALCERLPPDRLYRLKSSGHRVTLRSYCEDGTVTVNVTGQYNALAFDRYVFGIAPADLEECDLPPSDEPIGTVLTEQEDVDALIRMEVEQRHKNGERHNDLLCRLCSAPSLGADDAKT
jgi:hypothetical protein